MKEEFKHYLSLWIHFFIWIVLLFLGSIVYINSYAFRITKQKEVLSMIELYSLITILLIIIVGVTGLAFWYWSGRRPLKKH
ncbi:hypothetical protein Si077_00767 [Streptococcus infantarius subsp. infantarius]|nr:hypothetical protein [Streptococcus infantarius subsp. infantarius]